MDKTKKLLFGLLLGLLLFLPFHTLVTVWLTSSFGHLYVWSAWKEVVLAGIGVMASGVLVYDKALRTALWGRLYNKVAVGYVGLLVLYVLFQRMSLASLIGFTFNIRFIVIFLAVQVIAAKLTAGQREKTIKLVTITGFVVAILGVIQALILPPDVLTHFGYDAPGVDTLGIPPAYHTVAPGSDVVRAQSTLRGPNVLGAYLLIPFFLLAWGYMQTKKRRFLGAAAIVGVAIFLSHSRSAMGALILGLMVWVMLSGRTQQMMRRYWSVALSLVVAGLIALPFIWQTRTFQSVVLHHNPDVTTVQSNEGHVMLTLQAAEEVAGDPLGDGLGTAGPSSAVADKPSARIAENYFLQVGQETGWLGAALFVWLQALVLIALYKVRQAKYVVPIFLAMLAIVATNMLLHTWTDEVVSMVIWSLAGLVLGGQSVTSKKRTIVTR